jgi:hypothetical protein
MRCLCSGCALVAAGRLPWTLGIANRAMPIPRTYRLGTEFPSEAFVQIAIENRFRELGFAIDTSGHVDLKCSHPTTCERWHIEAKGKTAQPGLDFRTCLGQLVQRIDDSETRYAIALPDLPEYTAQIRAMSGRVVERLGIHWLLVFARRFREVHRSKRASTNRCLTPRSTGPADAVFSLRFAVVAAGRLTRHVRSRPTWRQWTSTTY